MRNTKRNKKRATKNRRRIRAIESLEARQLMHGHSLDDGAMQLDPPDHGEQSRFDFGDAPDVYGTLRSSLGPVHRIDSNVRLGVSVDSESDGQPSVTANLDDSNGLLDDEDGVRFLSPLVPGASTDIEVDASVDGYLTAWIDWRRDGSFDVVDQIFAAQVKAGTNTLTINVPPQASPAETYARFRFTSADTVLGPKRDPEVQSVAQLPDGEVEDYQVDIVAGDSEFTYDFGDAPDSYGTLTASAGPRHRIDPGVFLGAGGGIHIDGEADGQPNARAKGDDLTPTVLQDDEDGVRFVGSLVPGTDGTVQLVASTDGYVNAWVDFDQDGTFTTAERILHGRPVVAGANTFSISVPTDAVETTDNPTFSRFRFSTSHRFLTPKTIPVVGEHPNGEVEDHIVRIEAAEDSDQHPFDFGRLFGDHDFLAVRPGISIGAAVAGEADSNSSATPDEFDGVMLGEEEWRFVFQGTGKLSVMADWNDDGELSEDEEVGSWTASALQRMQQSVISASHLDAILASMPDVTPGTTVNVRAKFESFETTLDGIPFGEIVDLPWVVPEPEVEGQEYFDFGDAPNSYGTRLNNNGARHRITDGVRLGQRIDREADGKPSNGAWRDDLTHRDDEDGVFFTSAIVPGQVATVDVGVSRGNGLLDAWMDFNKDGTFTPNEQIFNSVAVTPGLNPLSFDVPAVVGNPAIPLYSRFRVSTAGGLSPVGRADDGEVEDYAVLPGDLNNDGVIDIQDADVLQSAIQGDGLLTTTVDLNGDGELNRKEMRYFRENIFLSVEGDLDGDGDSDFEDFLNFSANYGKRGAKYSEGDLDGDGETGFPDFLRFSESFGSSMERPADFGRPSEGEGIFLTYTFEDFDKIEWVS